MGSLPQLAIRASQSAHYRLLSVLSGLVQIFPEAVVQILLAHGGKSNHLDERNRRQVLRYLAHFSGTLLIISHGVNLLRQSVDTFWHIDIGHLICFLVKIRSN